jgi:cytochrome c
MKFLSGIAIVGMVCLASPRVFAQDKANGERVYKAKCTSCHGPDGKVALSAEIS